MDSRLKRLESRSVGPSGLQDNSQICGDDARDAALSKDDRVESEPLTDEHTIAPDHSLMRVVRTPHPRELSAEELKSVRMPPRSD